MDRQVTSRIRLERKQVDDVMGGEDSWKNVDSTDATCPKCDHGRAYYMQLQIRSADEPIILTAVTTFYKCTKQECGFQWREN
ncbi:RNA polymerase III C11 subunit [Malassezia brasiliensis]|uniref:DNA-directed RNA polymerase III subunit RPC10 n=1 Tax=Malassezia brasiliensis TaxID=1821822 RepID=A0AAF0DZP5_9BASI|nr:RNA polymerase III C11 subunit [Malassezia brasiliensis]